MLLILDDNIERLAAFKQISLQLAPDLAMVSWLDAPSMLADINRYLSYACLISLDHDLYKQTETDPDPGCGRDVADYLAGCAPVCPVIIHSSNLDASWGMYNELQFGGWQVVVVNHSGEAAWYSQNWWPIAKHLLQRR